MEPYALSFKWRQDGAGQEYLYVWDQTGGRSGPGRKSLLNWKITSLADTEVKFEPRFEIELAKAGEYGERTTFSSGSSSFQRRTWAQLGLGRSWVYLAPGNGPTTVHLSELLFRPGVSLQNRTVDLLLTVHAVSS